MKGNFYVCGLFSAITVMFATAIIASCSSDDDYEYREEQVYTMAPTTRSAMSPEAGFENPPFLNYSNCGLWGIACMCGNVDNERYQGAVLSAATSAINWDENANMEHLKNNKPLRGLSGNEILSVCNKMKEINNKASGFDKISKLNDRLPDTFESDSREAQKIVGDLMTKSNGKTINGVMVGLETIDENGITLEHWVPLENFTKSGDMQVRDPLTSQEYYNRERNSQSNFSDRYKNNYSVSRVKCILYKK